MLGPRHRLGVGKVDQPAETVLGVLRRQDLQPGFPCCSSTVVTNMAEYTTVMWIAER